MICRFCGSNNGTGKFDGFCSNECKQCAETELIIQSLRREQMEGLSACLWCGDPKHDLDGFCSFYCMDLFNIDSHK